MTSIPGSRRAAPAAAPTPAPARDWPLQGLMLPYPGTPGLLYLRQHDSRGHALPPVTRDGAIHLLPEEMLSTDTYFGAFYRSYWMAHCGLDQVEIALCFQGHVDIRVMEDTGAGVLCRLREVAQAEGPRDLRLAPVLSTPSGQPNSRLFVEVIALEASQVMALEIRSPTPPRRAPTLSIGLCTFNQEAYFARTLARLVALAERRPEILRIHVVNQGAPFAAPEIRALVTHPAVHLLEQRNLGGCGGFTRSLVEELAQKAPASHHLMMDDDIVLDERMIERALNFLAYAGGDIALGAPMLDSLRPTVVYEAGAFLLPNNTIEPYCHNIDMADPGEHWRFNAPVPSDYNAWWFCVLPLERARQAGLPAPVFIRGDDFEYGQRLARAGVPTVTLPGIAVWHEPFYAKPSGWQDYYDLRNRLIFGATYADKVSQLSLAHVLGLITTAALTHNYTSARLRLLAVEDYLRGPEGLFAEDAEAIHARVMEVARARPAERLGPEWSARTPAKAGKPRPARMGRLVLYQGLATLRALLLPQDRDALTAPVLLDSDVQPLRVAGRAYVATNGPRSFHLRFIPDRALLGALLRQAARLGLRYRRQRAAVDAAWAAQIAQYRTAEHWQASFAGTPGTSGSNRQG